MEITNNIVKWVYSLQQKKNRVKEQCFVVEGTKCVLDTLEHFPLRHLFCSQEWAEKHAGLRCDAMVVATKVQLERMSMLKTATDVIAVYSMPDYELDENEIRNSLNLVLDGVQDPGNLGTIIRIADWFGIRNIICSENTVDVYNPKVVQATMGAISRVKVFYRNLPDVFREYASLPVYGTFLDGTNLYEEELSASGFVVMGNEGNGISKELEKFMTKRLLIPSYLVGIPTSESLNVGMATAVIVSEFRRRMM